jgi:hypothetical protein
MSAKPNQEAFDFGRLYKVADASRAMYRVLNDAVDMVGILPAAGACGIDRGDLRRALDRDGRRMAIEHVMAIGALVQGQDIRTQIGGCFVKPLELAVCAALPELTDKERADRCEAALRALGPLGEAARVAALSR